MTAAVAFANLKLAPDAAPVAACARLGRSVVICIDRIQDRRPLFDQQAAEVASGDTAGHHAT